jgi:hypothetical protein
MSSTGLSFGVGRGKAAAMEKKPDAPSRPDGLSRDERLAAKLRENLKRRKAQARAQDQGVGGQDDNAALPKQPPEG